MQRVRKGRIYVYEPDGWDRIDPKTVARAGDRVRVVHPFGCPPPNTMGCCHVETPEGEFLGLVSCASLHP